MWYFFSKRGEVEEIPSELDTVDTKLTCSDVVQLASVLSWEEWAVFLTMARNHKIDAMTKPQVESLFKEYKRGERSVPVDTCTPRQLTEFLYLLTPERWQTFNQFMSSVDVNALSFTDLLLQFHTFEYETTRPHLQST